MFVLDAVVSSDDGANWDLDASPPDVFVEVSLETGQGAWGGTTTPVESDMPAWNESVMIAPAHALLDVNGDMSIALIDEDLAANDHIASTGFLPGAFYNEQTLLTGAEQVFEYDINGVEATLRYRFEPVQ